MKNSTCLLLLTLLLACSFTGSDDDGEKGTFSANVDGKNFQLAKDQLFRGILVKKSGSMDGRTPARVIINTNFNGTMYDMPNGKSFTESVQFEINYDEDKTGDIPVFGVGLQYQSTNYSMVKEQSKLKLTQFSWEPDHKHFRMSADFDCKMRSWGYPSDNKKDISLRGKMSNIRITVPSWITAKN